MRWQQQSVPDPSLICISIETLLYSCTLTPGSKLKKIQIVWLPQGHILSFREFTQNILLEIKSPK